MRGFLHRWPLALLGLLCVASAPRVADAQQCRLCENGTYCFLETLFVCPLNSRSLPGSDNITNCVYIPGYYARDSIVCQPCEPGSFCPGNESLQPCPRNSSSNVFAAGAIDCFCVPGFSGANDACATCLQGSAQACNGSAACELCAVGQFQDEFPQASVACVRRTRAPPAAPAPTTCPRA